MRRRGLLASVLLLGACAAPGGGTGSGPDAAKDAGAEVADAAADDAPDPDVSPDGGPGEPVVLFRDGASGHVIVLPPDPSPSQLFAAEELRSHVEACTGVSLPVLDAAPREGTPMIVLGAGPLAESLGVAPAPGDLGEQGFLLRTVPPHVV
ncbi:MAG: hypothetical protein FJ098_12255, partial [Deltaproteobacteria bacterium]|nr:hypothetical protein [Deltaproteobacteria bacterium]